MLKILKIPAKVIFFEIQKDKRELQFLKRENLDKFDLFDSTFR